MLAIVELFSLLCIFTFDISLKQNVFYVNNIIIAYNFHYSQLPMSQNASICRALAFVHVIPTIHDLTFGCFCLHCLQRTLDKLSPVWLKAVSAA